MKTFALLTLVPLVALADVGLQMGGTAVGPVRNLDCVRDGGFLCYRDAGTATGKLQCNAAGVLEPGCVIPGAQSFGSGTKTFTGLVQAPSVDAGIVGADTLYLTGDVAAARDVIASRDMYALTYNDFSGAAPTYLMNSQSVGAVTATRLGFFNPASPGLTDKLVSFGYDASSWTSLAWFNGIGVLKSATPFTLLIGVPNAALVAGTTYGATRLATGGDANFTVTAIDVDVTTAGSGGTSNAKVRVSNGSSSCDLTFACNGTAAVRSNSGTSANATLAGTCAFSADDTLTLTANSIGDCSTGPVTRNISVIGKWQ